MSVMVMFGGVRAFASALTGPCSEGLANATTPSGQRSGKARRWSGASAQAHSGRIGVEQGAIRQGEARGSAKDRDGHLALDPIL